MLVLSRKQDQSIVFPNLGIRIKVLRVAGNAVRVGVDAPNEIRVLRGELADSNPSTVDSSGVQAKGTHEMRSRLNEAGCALKSLQKHLEAGKIDDAEESLAIALEAIAEMEQIASAPLSCSASSESTSANSPASNTGEAREHACLVEDLSCVKENRSDYHFGDRPEKMSSRDRGVQGWFQGSFSPDELVKALGSSLN